MPYKRNLKRTYIKPFMVLKKCVRRKRRKPVFWWKDYIWNAVGWANYGLDWEWIKVPVSIDEGKNILEKAGQRYQKKHGGINANNPEVSP